ncbi:hypothetical protein B481_1853 [Planococcus halocryophilus Or1]|nr:hypothetical protein B481_1853 [Planococcus halocryophilus Or1]
MNEAGFLTVFNALLEDSNANLLVAEKEQNLIRDVFVLPPAFYT